MIKVHNTGKGDYQSFEATLEIDGLDGALYGYGNATVSGYGATEEEALENLKKNVVDVQVQLSRKLAAKVQYVDYAGRPL